MRRLLCTAVVALVTILVGAATSVQADVRTKTLEVKGSNDEYTEAGMNVSPGDVVVIRAAGEIRMPGFLGRVSAGPWGAASTVSNVPSKSTPRAFRKGSLLGKAGTTSFPVGDTYVSDSLEGPLKFKVFEAKANFEGAFNVFVIIVPNAERQQWGIKSFTVAANSDEYVRTEINLGAGDTLAIGAPDAEIKLSGGTAAGVWGAAGFSINLRTPRVVRLGCLIAKIGDTKLPVGDALVVSGHVGPVKLKVEDTKYDDNSGSFTVLVAKLPRVPQSAAGPASVPPAIVLPGQATIQGRLDSNAVAGTIRRGMGAVRTCYQRALKRNPVLAGDLVLVIQVSPSGQVEAVRPIGRLPDTEIGTCLVGYATRWRFPPPSAGKATIHLPLSFRLQTDKRP